MPTRWSIAALIYMMVASVLFGIGPVTFLSIPTLSESAATLMPAVIAASFVISVPISLFIAPKLRARYQRRLHLVERGPDGSAKQR
ncbi:MAG TPA: hypothetical protein PK970_08785 [Hyphomicrobiaceae bacterium]|nr:hypothetical protein [Hyphomicrobiaceae bacterium]